MKSVGLITEYNPFHNGHLFHATLSKQRSETNVTIAIMSGNFRCVENQQSTINLNALKWLYPL